MIGGLNDVRWCLRTAFFRRAMRFVALLFALTLTVFCSRAVPQDLRPEIDRIDQGTTGRVGESLSVRIDGRQLGEVRHVLFFGPGLRLQGVLPTGPEQLVLEIEVAENCRVGEHWFVLASPRGFSDLRSVYISSDIVAAEEEDNDEPDAAQPITLPITMTGIIEEGDQDCFSVALRRGQRLSVDAVAMPLSRYLFDAAVELLDQDGRRLLYVDDHPLSRQDPIFSWIAQHDGTYYVRIREAAFGGDLDARYRLQLSHRPRPTVAFPAEFLASGQPQSIQLLGDAAGPFDFFPDPKKIDRLLEGDGRTVRLGTSLDLPSSSAKVMLRMAEVAGIVEQEPNDVRGQANQWPHSMQESSSRRDLAAFNGILASPGDVDCFGMDLRTGDILDARVHAAALGAPLDTTLTVIGPNGQIVASNDDAIIHDSALRIYAATDGVHTLRVTDQLGRGGPTSIYRVELRRPEPALQVMFAAPQSAMPESLPSILVPKGSAVPVRIACRRQGFEGDVTVEATDLPEGVTWTSLPISTTNYVGNALVSADETVTDVCHLIGLKASGTSSNGTVLGSLAQRVGLVYGEPRKAIYHSATIDRIPVLVTEPARFSVAAESPTATLVQNGQLRFHVRVDREPGYQQPVSIELLSTPAWLRGPERPLTIGSQSSEGWFTLNADRRAEPGDYSVILAATSFDAGRSITIASSPVKIRVAHPRVEGKIVRTAAEAGRSTQVRCSLGWLPEASLTPGEEQQREYTVTLLGLPAGATSVSRSAVAGETEVIFPVTLDDETPVGLHNTLALELKTVVAGGTEQSHFIGHGGVLEVLDRGANPAPEKSRLEILRRQQSNRGDR